MLGVSSKRTTEKDASSTPYTSSFTEHLSR